MTSELRDKLEALPQIELWFFRDIDDEARRKLIALCLGQDVADEAKFHDWQRKCLRRILNTRANHLVVADGDALGEAVGLLREAEGYVESSHDEGCETDPEYGEAAFDSRMDEEDPDGDTDAVWPRDAKCTCGTDTLSNRIATFLTRMEARNG